MVEVKLQYQKGLFKAFFLFIAIAIFFGALSGCAGMPPLVDQAKAIEAQKYAKKNQASKHAHSHYIKGVAYLKRAHKYFENRVYEKAKKAYILSARYFEKSETKARVFQAKKGGEF